MLKDEQDDRQGEPCPGLNGVVTTRRPPNLDSASPGTTGADRRLRLNPNNDHKPESYDDLQLDYKASIFSSLERHLPSSMLGVSRDEKVQFMSEILARYLPDNERVRVQKHSEYRQKIMANYQPLHKALYDMQPAAFFVPSFINAINENNKQTLRSMIHEPSPGVYTFSMLSPSFCEMLLAEVENFEKWVQETRCKIMRPNTLNKYGAVLDDFGMESMLSQLMHEFVSPMSKDDCKTTELWNIFSEIYSQISEAHILYLKREFRNLSKGTMSIMEYLGHIKGISDQLGLA